MRNMLYRFSYEVSILLHCDTMSLDNWFAMFWDNPLLWLHIPEEWVSHPHHWWNLKTHKFYYVHCITENELEIHSFVKYSHILTNTGKLKGNLVSDVDNFPFMKVMHYLSQWTSRMCGYMWGCSGFRSWPGKWLYSFRCCARQILG